MLCAITDTGVTVAEEATRRLFDLPSAINPMVRDARHEDALAAETKRQKETIMAELSQKQAQWFDEEIDKLNNWAEDKRRGLKFELKEYDDQVNELKKAARLAGNLPEKLTAQKKIRDLDAKRNAAWKEYDEASKVIEDQKDSLLDSVEARLSQTMSEQTIFTIHWSVV